MEDEGKREEWDNRYNKGGQNNIADINQGSWNSHTDKVDNTKRSIDTYKSKQSELSSTAPIFESTDYSHLKPNTKPKGHGDDDGYLESGYKHGMPTRKREPAIDQVGGNWLTNGRQGGRINNDPKKYDPSNKK